MDVRIVALAEQIQVQPFGPSLERWALACSSDSLAPDLPPGAVARALERHWQARETLLLLAHGPAREAPLGGLLTLPYEDPLSSQREALIVLLYVEDSFRRRGLARALAKEARQILLARGCTRVLARAAHNDDALISMGERWGYVRQHEVMLLE